MDEKFQYKFNLYTKSDILSDTTNMQLPDYDIGKNLLNWKMYRAMHDPEFAKNASKGDIILAGKNFGCGSSREQPVLGFKALGIEVIIAVSFARIFYRAAINQGLILAECSEAVHAYKDRDELIFSATDGKIKISGQEFTFPKLPPEILAIRDAGGLLPYTRSNL